MTSSVSTVLQDQIVYATPWYQRMYSTNPPSLDDEIENRIIQTVTSGEISRVPSSNAVYEFLSVQTSHRSFTIKTTELSTSHTILHNLNSEFLLYNILVWNGHQYVSGSVNVIELDVNTLIIESAEPINIKVTIIKI